MKQFDDKIQLSQSCLEKRITTNNEWSKKESSTFFANFQELMNMLNVIYLTKGG